MHERKLISVSRRRFKNALGVAAKMGLANVGAKGANIFPVWHTRSAVAEQHIENNYNSTTDEKKVNDKKIAITNSKVLKQFL